MQFTPTQKRAGAWTAIAALAMLARRALGPVLTPFVVAAVPAYALTPLVDRLDALKGGRMRRCSTCCSTGGTSPACWNWCRPGCAAASILSPRKRSGDLAGKLHHS